MLFGLATFMLGPAPAGGIGPTEFVGLRVSNATNASQPKPSSIMPTNPDDLPTYMREQRVLNSRHRTPYHWISRRHYWKPRTEPPSFNDFYKSVFFLEWLLFIVVVAGFMVFHVFVFPVEKQWHQNRGWYTLKLGIWMAVATVYNMAYWHYFDASKGASWFEGYVLEFIFSVENVLVFYSITETFRMPRNLVMKALAIVVVWQIIFQTVLYMGLAHWFQSFHALPYVMGAWLFYVGIQTVRHGESTEDMHDHEHGGDFAGLQYARGCMGGFLTPWYDQHGSFFVCGDRGLRCTPFLPAVVCLVAADFLMEIDVTLTKIEEIEDDYVGLTSSALAAFALPELFWLVRDLFREYEYFKYGIAFVLIFLACELMLIQFVEVPEVVNLVVIVVVLLACVAMSYWHGHAPGARGAAAGADQREHEERK